jgi:hypothetical protein
LFTAPWADGANQNEGALYIVAPGRAAQRRLSGQPAISLAYYTIAALGRALSGNRDCFAASFGGKNELLVFNAVESKTLPIGIANRTGVASAGDIDGDGLGDVAVSEPTWDGEKGRVTVWSPASSQMLRELHGQLQLWAFSTAGDVDADGIEDLLVRDSIGWNLNRQELRIVSGRDGRVLQSMAGTYDPNVTAAVSLGGSGADGRASFAIGGSSSQDGVFEVWTPNPAPLGAHVEQFGNGCPAKDGRLPRVVSRGTPSLGQVFTLELHTAPRLATGVLMFDYARQALDLGIIGFPGCVQRALPRLLVVRQTDVTGFATVAYSIPVDASLLGGEVHHQWLAVDLQTATAAVTSGLTIRVGER